MITEARKKAGLTQEEVAERLRRADGRTVLAPYLNDLEHDRRYPPENEVIEQSYGRFMRKDFLGPLIGARPESLREAPVGGETGPLTGALKEVLAKRSKFPSGILVEAGGIEPPSEDRRTTTATRLVRVFYLAA